MQVQNFTTTLSSSTINFLDTISKKDGVSKREVIEQALQAWQNKRIKNAIRKSYRSASGNSEMSKLANAGLLDWEDSIRAWEKS